MSNGANVSSGSKLLKNLHKNYLGRTSKNGGFDVGNFPCRNSEKLSD